MASIQEKFITAIDQKSGRFRIDGVTITTPNSKYKAAGILDCGDKIVFSITLPRGKDIPEPPRSMVARKDFWKLKGTVEGGIRISIDNLPPSGKRKFGNGITTIVLEASELEIEPDHWDKKTHAQIRKIINAHKSTKDDQPPKRVETKPKKKESPEVTFFAVIKNYKLMAFNKGTEIVETNAFLGEQTLSRSDTFMENLPGWRYGLIQAQDDLHVYMKSDENYESKGKDDDRRCLDAFLRAIAFTHGQHAWPSRLQYRREHRMLTNQVRIVRRTNRTPHAPFSERLWLSTKSGNVQWEFSDTIRKAYEFFFQKTELSEEVEELLYLFREAGGNDIPLQIELLTICSLYESLMRAIFARQSHGQPKTAEVLAFVETKSKFVEELKKRRLRAKGLKADSIARMGAILGSASAESIREIVQIVSAGLLKGTSFDWKEIHKEWSSFRNPLSHKISGQSGSSHDFGRDLLAVSRISGAINVAILKIMGYSGFARVSTFDDKYVTV